jgi:surface antigen
MENFLQTMTDKDVEMANSAVQKALETLKSSDSLRWQNPSSKNSGQVTPDRTYQTKGGVFCRVYTEALTLRNQTEQFEGTACRDDDGVWQPI